MKTKTDNYFNSPVLDSIKSGFKDPIIRTIIIVAGAILLVYLSGIVFKIVAGTITHFKSMQSAYRM